MSHYMGPLDCEFWGRQSQCSVAYVECTLGRDVGDSLKRSSVTKIAPCGWYRSWLRGPIGAVGPGISFAMMPSSEVINVVVLRWFDRDSTVASHLGYK